MNTPKPLFPKLDRPARVIVLMSGSGSNAEVLIRASRMENSSFTICALVTDRPERCRAREIASMYHLPLVECDIFDFYKRNGENSIRLDTPHRRELRNEWNALLEKAIEPFAPDFGALAGFVPLTNLAAKLPLLNVHPGDLTATDETGRRLYTGLHHLPVELAILDGVSGLRSSVILAQPYSGDGNSDMDSGPVLGVSGPVAPKLDGAILSRLKKLYEIRIPGVTPSDRLREVADASLEELKYHGDHVIFPRVVSDFALGKYAVDANEQLYYEIDSSFVPVETIEYPEGAAPNPRVIK